MTVVRMRDDLKVVSGKPAMAKTSEKQPARTVPGSTVAPPAMMTPDDRREAGKRLRDTVPRDAHGAWRAHADRTDPLSILRPRTRPASRTGAAALWPHAAIAVHLLPWVRRRHGGRPGPNAGHGIHVQACGDAHLMNFGGFATPERRLILDINDLDETLPAPWEWDVKRLVASFVLAARSNGLSDDNRARCGDRLRPQLPPGHARLSDIGRAGNLVRPA